MKVNRFISVLVVGFVGLFLVSLLSTAVMANPEDTEQLQLAQKDPPPPPKTVSPKDPDVEAPFPALNCPHCGKQIPSRWGKGANARPRLGAGCANQEFLMQGRHGMQGRRMGCGTHPGQMGRRGMRGRKMGCGVHPGQMGRRGAGQPSHFAMLLRHADILGLTEDQQTKLKELKFSAEKEMIDLKAALQKEQLELRKLMHEEDLNARSIKRQLETAAQARTNLKFHQISLLIEARNILTDEQRELIKEKLHRFGGPHLRGDLGPDCDDMFMCFLEDCYPDLSGGPQNILHEIEEE